MGPETCVALGARLCPCRAVCLNRSSCLKGLAGRDPLAVYTLGWVLARSGEQQAGGEDVPKSRGAAWSLLFSKPAGGYRRSRSCPALQIRSMLVRPTTWVTSGMLTANTRKPSPPGNAPASLTQPFPPCIAIWGWPTFNERGDAKKALARFEEAFRSGIQWMRGCSSNWTNSISG